MKRMVDEDNLIERIKKDIPSGGLNLVKYLSDASEILQWGLKKDDIINLSFIANNSDGEFNYIEAILKVNNASFNESDGSGTLNFDLIKAICEKYNSNTFNFYFKDMKYNRMNQTFTMQMGIFQEFMRYWGMTFASFNSENIQDILYIVYRK